MRILLIARDQRLLRLMRKALCEQPCAIDAERDASGGGRMACLNDYDLVIMDGALEASEEACAFIRAYGKCMPIMIVSGDAQPQSKVRMFEAGADDYLTSPFALSEFLARVQALSRRPLTYAPPALAAGQLVLCTKSGIVRYGKRDIGLTRKEFMLLEYLMRNAGSVVSRAMILEHVWDMSVDAFTNTIETHILTLRRKLSGAGCCPGIIATVPGRGYRISPSDTHA